MSKYEPLTRHLKAFPLDAWDASFNDIEKVLKAPLPPSARKHQSWWGNATSGNHSQSKGWIDAGWWVRHIDLPNRKVRLERWDGNQVEASSELATLWRRARELSGIANRAELEKAMLNMFIRRTAAKNLIKMGGTMPDFEAAPRERPFA